MHLLNDSQSLDLPSVQQLAHNASTNDSLSLPPIEPDTGGQRGDKSATQQIPPFRSITDDLPSRQNLRPDGPYQSEAASTSNTNVYSLHQLRGDSESLHLPPILSLPTDPGEDTAPKKRQRALTVHPDFGPLPQPLKKRKSTQQVVPPIINGLLEPPQDAAVFPPIVGHFDDADASNLNALKEFTVVEVERLQASSAESNKPGKPEKANRGKAKRRIGKPRRKWSEDETNNLLLGVNKHGVGKWTSILEDPEYSFNERTAGDLKDRFRTCCPAELREQLSHKDSGSERPRAASRAKPKKGFPIENILNENILVNDEDLGEERKGPSSVASLNHDSDSAGTKKGKGRAHRKNIEDLEELGILAPFKKSERRERRPFTEQDDKEILDGLYEYGPAWTKIQRDTRFNLATRQPTDLRDRVRNKYPDIYASIEKGSFHSIQLGRGTTKILEPSVNTSAGNQLAHNPFESHLDRSSSKENLSRSMLPSSGMTESFDSLPGISSFDMGEGSSNAYMTKDEEMSIARLMIEDPVTNDYGTGALDERPFGGGSADRSSTTLPRLGEAPKSPGRLIRPLNGYPHRDYW